MASALNGPVNITERKPPHASPYCSDPNCKSCKELKEMQESIRLHGPLQAKKG